MAEEARLDRQSVVMPLPMGPKGPPAEFKMFSVGANATVYGDYWLAEDGGADAQSLFEAMGIDLAFDWHHWSEKVADPKAPVDPENTKAAGWFGLEARAGDGLYVVKPPHLEGATAIHWTPLATSQLENLEYRYFSGSLLTVKDDQGRRWIVGVTSCALTNRPATIAQKPLLASAVPFDGAPLDKESTSWDGASAEQGLRAWASSDGSGDPDKMDWAKYREGFAWYDQSSPDSFGSYKLPHHVIVAGKLETSQAGVEAAAAAIEGSRGGVEIPASDLAGVKSHLSKHYQQWGAPAPWEASMTDQEKAKDLAKEKAYLSAERVAAMVRMILKKGDDVDASELCGGLQALADRAGKYDEAVAQIEAITVEKNEVEAKAYLSEAKFQKKIAPTEEAHLLSWGKSDPKQLKAYLADKPRAIPGLDVKEAQKGKGDTGPAVTLEDGRKYEDLKPIERHNLATSQPETYKLMREDYDRRKSALR